MKRICAFVLVFCTLFSCAYAVDTLHSNERYPFVSCGPFWFVVPSGFKLDKTHIGDPMYINSAGELFGFTYVPGAAAHLISEDTEETLRDLESLVKIGSAGDQWAGTLYAEKSGGCYKIGSLLKNDPVGFAIAAICPEGYLFIGISPANSSSGMDLAHGIFKTLSYQEYRREYR